jgi:hypothetical protein
VVGLTLLDSNGDVRAVDLQEPSGFARPASPLTSRSVFAAVHVVPAVHGENTPGSPAAIDWDATMEIRRGVYRWGLGIADAMDTAQRNMGLDPVAIRQLIAESARVAREEAGRLVVGINTDHLESADASIDEIITAYSEQRDAAQDAGAELVLMASRHLARAAQSADDYRRVYRTVLNGADRPVILHWLGPVFDPALDGYFGSSEFAAAADTVLSIVSENVGAVAGIKMSLLNASAEKQVRRRLPDSVRMYTGDDFNYVDLIGGDDLGLDDRHSDALLGAFAAIAPHASASIQALDAHDPDAFRRILTPTEALSRHIFSAPTFYYKTGVAFMSWLNGHQASFQMVGGLHAARSLPHLSRIAELANACRALEDPELAAARWESMLLAHGVSLAGRAR